MKIDSVHGAELKEDGCEFVGRRTFVCPDAPPEKDLSAVPVEARNRVGIADIHPEKHTVLIPPAIEG